MTYRLAKRAEADLEDIAYYIAKESGSLETARRVIESITDRFHLLGANPYAGRARDDDLGPGRRSFPADRYIIVYVWSVENHGGDTHVHWIVHVPKPLLAAFNEKLPLWLARVAGTVHCSVSAIKVQPVKNLRGLDHYLLKGMDPRYAPRYRVRHDPQGLVFGKRCGISKSPGPAARQRGPGDRRAA